MTNALLNITKPVSKQKFSEGNKSAGILDDFAVRKVINSIEGTMEKTPTNAKDITNKEYVDDKSLKLPLKQDDTKFYLDFTTNTYLKYDIVSGEVQLFVNGTIKASW